MNSYKKNQILFKTTKKTVFHHNLKKSEQTFGKKNKKNKMSEQNKKSTFRAFASRAKKWFEAPLENT
jgi:hypothetical protein